VERFAELLREGEDPSSEAAMESAEGFTDSTYALLAARLRRWLSGPVAQGPIPRYASGSVYIGLGISTALTDLEA